MRNVPFNLIFRPSLQISRKNFLSRKRLNYLGTIFRSLCFTSRGNHANWEKVIKVKYANSTELIEIIRQVENAQKEMAQDALLLSAHLRSFRQVINKKKTADLFLFQRPDAHLNPTLRFVFSAAHRSTMKIQSAKSSFTFSVFKFCRSFKINWPAWANATKVNMFCTTKSQLCH